MKQIPILIAFLIFAALANAQTKIDTAAIIRQYNIEHPAYIVCFSTKKSYSTPAFVVRGYLKAGQPLDSKHRPLPDYIMVLNVLERKVKK